MEVVHVVRHQRYVQHEVIVQHEYVVQQDVDVESGARHEVQVVVI